MSAVNVLRKRLAFATPLLESLFSLEAIISEWWVNEGGKMSTDTVEKLITNAIHTAFIKYPEGDGSPNTPRVMAVRTWTMNGFRPSTARMLPKRFFWTWQPTDLRLLRFSRRWFASCCG